MVSKIRRSLGLPLVFLIIGIEASVNNGLTSISITRHHKGDLFVAQGETCYEDLCLGMSSGTASPTDSSGCNCQCMPNLPIFRDDLHICVDDIQECTLAPFQSGTTMQKVPYVFLPLRGQIVYPSAEIVVSDVANPICVVSGAQFLGRRGWVQLRNNSETDLPFRLFRDEGRTYLQWLGESDLRLAMEGRLILVHLMCKDASGEEELQIFTPCISFRVAGNPSGPREMMFATDKGVVREGDRSLSVSEYIAIGVCILLLGLIYVASLIMYFHYRKKKKQRKKTDDGGHLTVAEEGIVKSNPLLHATRRHLAAVAGQDNGGYASDSGSCCSESDRCSDVIPPDEDDRNFSQNMEIAAMVHPCNMGCNVADTLLNQDANNIEKLPEEDVSIVETLEMKEDRPETVRSMGSANVRKKLYFNPAYFELDMLKAPPPAAIEFLTKIREVIAVAKHKMSAKRFSPSLNGIPEEEYYSRGGKPNSTGNRSRPASVLSHTGSVECKRNKTSCMTCVEDDAQKIENSYNLAATSSCCPNDTKQRIIRKWLEDVPFVKSLRQEHHEKDMRPSPSSGNKDNTEVTETKEENKTEEPAKTAVHGSPKMTNEGRKPPAPPQRKENKKSVKGPAPPRPPPPPPVVPIITEKDEYNSEWKKALNFSSFNKAPSNNSSESVKPPPPPMHAISKVQPTPLSSPITHQEDADNIPRVQGKDKVPPVVAKNLMDAVIQELIVQRKNEKSVTHVAGVHNFIKKTLKSNFDMVHVKNARNEKFHQADKNIFEMDSLERNTVNADSDETAAVNAEEEANIDENTNEDKLAQSNEAMKEIDSYIEVYNDAVVPKNKETIDSIIETNEKRTTQDDHDYEVILLNSAETTVEQDEKEKELKIYNLPEILSKNERSEGYSLVSEVYVNDGYSYSSDGSTKSNNSNSSKGKNRSVSAEKPGRLTIHVKDSPDNYKHIIDETANFEPDTLDRKPGKFRYSKTIGNWEESVQEQYSNQRFHEMDLDCKHGDSNNNENFIDSLERPRISLRTSGSFRRNSIEKDVDELFKNLDAPLQRHFGSLREIYEAKSRGHRKRTETTSLIGSVPSKVDCRSTLSWSEDRRNKLLHRGIILHMADETRKPRRPKVKPAKVIYPDVVPPRPPKPPSLSDTPNQRSTVSTPGTRSYCPSPASRSACTSPPPRSNCTSPRPVTIQFPPPPPPPPPPPRSMNIPRNCSSPNRSGRTSPFLPPSRSMCSSPTCFSDISCSSKCMIPQPPPRSLCSSPVSHKGRSSPSAEVMVIPPPPRVTSGMKQWNPISPTPSSPACSASTSPILPPRPPSRTLNNSPPLPPRSSKPPLPPKNVKSTRQRKHGSEAVHGRHSLARRPLPPIPSPRHYQDSTLSSVSSRDLETLSMLSGASIDSLNSSDYEAFYTLPYDGHDGEIFDKAQSRTEPAHKTIQILNSNSGSDTVFLTREDGSNVSRVSTHSRGNSGGKCGRGKKGAESTRSWRKDGRTVPHRLEDPGYLSTDSESGRRHRAETAVSTSDNAGSQGSETEESLCDGASESGAESIATDSFFFGNFNRAKTAGSLDSGVGSEVHKSFMHSFGIIGHETNAESEGRDLCITVRQ